MYGSVEGANTYFTTERLDRRNVWSTATIASKQIVLKEATQIVERLNFAGEKASQVQELEFPRKGQTEIPQDIIKAVYEIAYNILDGRDIDFEAENLDKRSMAIGGIRSTSRQDVIYSESKINGVPSIRAWRYLKPYLVDPSNIRLTRSS